MMMNYTKRTVVLAFCLFFSGLTMAAPDNNTAKTEAAATQTTAAPEDPIKMLKGVSDNVLGVLKANKQAIDDNPKKLYALVDKYVLPYVDFNEMSVWVAGRTAWGKAPEKSKEAFISEFKILVVRTYATALKSYSNEKVNFPPQKVDLNKERVQITSSIIRTGKENINLNYRLVKHENTWLVYDIIIEGVSILQGFQSQFTDEIRQRGLDHVIAQIRDHNQKGTV